MKKLSCKMKILTLIAVVFSFLIFPTVSPAGEVDYGPFEFGPGSRPEIIDLSTSTMSVTGSPPLKSLSISVQNGTKSGKNRVSSAVVSLNGKEMFVQKNFSQNVSSLIGELDVVAPSMASVELKVKVNGKKSARLFITVTAVYEDIADVAWFWFNPGSESHGKIGYGTNDVAPDDLENDSGYWIWVGSN